MKDTRGYRFHLQCELRPELKIFKLKCAYLKQTPLYY